MKEMLKSVLQNHKDDEDVTSYAFGRHLVFSEAGNFDFPKMFAKLGGRKWKGGDISKTLSKYFDLLGFGLNAPKAYDKEEDKPEWWLRSPKWRKFRNASKASKEDCTLLIKLLLEHYGIQAEMHYVGYPDQEGEDEESSSSEEEAGDEDDSNDAEEGNRTNYVLRQ